MLGIRDEVCKIESMRSQYNRTKKHISDSNFVVVSRDGREVKYQVECQSKPDKSMSIRFLRKSFIC